MTAMATARSRWSPRAIEVAVALDRLSQARIGERLAEVLVGAEVVDVRAFERTPRRRVRRAA